MSTLPNSKRALFLSLGSAILSESGVNDASTEETLAAAEEWRCSHERKLRQLVSPAKDALSARTHADINPAAAWFFSPIVQGKFDDVLQSAGGYLQKLNDKVREDIEWGRVGCEDNFRAMLVLFSNLGQPL